MLAIFNTIGQLVGGLCRDHTIAKGLSLKFATSGGLELKAQWAGRQSEGLATAFAPLYVKKMVCQECFEDTKRPGHRSLTGLLAVRDLWAGVLVAAALYVRNIDRRLRGSEATSTTPSFTRYETGSVVHHQKPGRRLLVALQSHRQH